ncbi:MAG: YkgJ family cysteine cluster protein, partial [Desulfuromonadales bacterium]|nr:YkgJ family cysteine cluster protein [Desulfuromonadales bacterium]
MLKTWCQKWRDKLKPGTGCLACGCCCELFGGYLHASKADLERWRQLGRDDLLNLVNPYGWIWIDPQDGRRGMPCPFRQRLGSEEVRCAIHDIKPDICRTYPTLDHGRTCVRGIYIPRPPPRPE